MTKLLRLVIAFTVVVALVTPLQNVKKVSAGAPYPPQLTCPPDQSTAVSNPPQLCAVYDDPEGDSGAVRFEVRGGGEQDHISDWFPATDGQTIYWTDTSPWSPGAHQWQARARDASAESGASSSWVVYIPEPPPVTPTCSIDAFTFSVADPQPVGVTIQLYARATCTNGVRGLRFLREGTEIGYVNGAEGSISYSTAGLSAGNHNFVVQAEDNVAGYIKDASDSYDLTNSARPPPPDVNCNVDSLTVFPASPQPPGTLITINASASCNTGVRDMRILIDGGIIWQSGMMPSFSFQWNPGSLTGDHRISVEVAGMGDDNWSQKAEHSLVYTFSQSAPPPQQPSFETGSLIQIGNDIYVVIDGARRLIPNPETLDALGLSRSLVNNRGFSDEALMQIGRGSDVPDVNRDPSGFNTFKATFFPNTQPIVPGNPPPSDNGGSNPPAVDNSCPATNAGISVGIIAVVTENLRVHVQPGLNTDSNFTVSKYTNVSIISGSTCRDGHRWWEIGYEGRSGWVTEAYLIPNGNPMPDESNDEAQDDVDNPAPAGNPEEVPSGQTNTGSNEVLNISPGGEPVEIIPNVTSSDRYLGSPFNPGGTVVFVTVDSLRLREGPGTNTTQLGYVVNGHYYPLIRQENGWANITTASGQTGWVSLEFAQVIEGSQTSSQETAIVCVNESGQQVIVAVNSGNFNQDNLDGSCSMFIYPGGDDIGVVPVSGSTIYEGSNVPLVSVDFVQINVSNLRVRSGPGIENSILGYVVENDYYRLIQTQGDWGKIDLRGSEGWIYLDQYSQIFIRQNGDPIITIGPTIEYDPTWDYEVANFLLDCAELSMELSIAVGSVYYSGVDPFLALQSLPQDVVIQCFDNVLDGIIVVSENLSEWLNQYVSIRISDQP